MIDFEFWESIAMTEMVALMGQLINQKQYLNYDVIFIFKIKNENKNLTLWHEKLRILSDVES